MGPTSRGTALLWLLAAVSIAVVQYPSPRVRRESRGTESLLTVEWEGIQTGDHPDSDVKGFLVEFRSEKEKEWHVHPGIIPYKGPNHQYRVQIPRLPTGISYFVRIKVLGENNDILVQTPEIRARNEIVSIKCENDEISATRNLEVTHDGQFSLAIRWDAPDCGSIGEYQVELAGVSSAFDVHRQTVTHPHVSVTNLLPGTIYNVRIRAADRSRQVGPWNSEVLQAKTKGDALPVSPAIHIQYVTDSEIRVSWDPLDDERIQHYEVVAVEQGSAASHVERVRVSPLVNSYALTGLRPNTRYLIGVIAFVDHEPRRVYRSEASTTSTVVEEIWEEKPQVMDQGGRHFSIHWRQPATVKPVFKFVLEYRLPNETHWRSTEETIADETTGDYHVELPHLEGIPFYSIRLVSIDRQNHIVSRTEEITVGEAAENSCVGLAGVPLNVRAVVVDTTKIRYEWNKPNCDEGVAPIDGYEYLMHEASKQPSHDAASYIGGAGVTIQDLIPNTRYSFRVRSRSGNGHSPWSGVVSTESHLTAGHDAGVSQPSSSLSLSQPRVEQHGSRTIVYWTAEGDASQVFGFQLDIRSDGEREWRETGGMIRSEPSQNHYRQALGALPVASYFLRVRAVDGTMSTIATSTSTSFAIRCQNPMSPDNVRLDRVSDSTVRVSWVYPQEDAACQTYFFISGTQNGKPIHHRLPGNERSFDIQGPAQGDWRVEIRAVNSAGSGPSSRQAVFTSAQQSLVSTPRVSARGNDLLVDWRSEGDGRGVYGYRIQYRKPSSGWFPYGQVVPYTGDNQEYSQLLTGLEQGQQYSVHIQVLDRNSYVMYVSPEANTRSSCYAPSQPPSHLQLEAPDAGHVKVSWALPPQSSWGCADLQFEIQVDEPRGVAPAIVDGHHISHIFNSHPNQPWVVRLRSKNSAGHSAWTPAAQTRTPPGGELILGPDVSYRQGSPTISWKSKENVGDMIESYVLEWKPAQESEWREHGHPIPFIGWQRPYSVDLGQLPKGHVYQVRIVAKDPNRGTAYTSPVVSVQTQSDCRAPRRPPTNLQVSPIGPTQIRLTWAPLHESEWNCDRLWYIVKYSTPKNQGFKNLTSGENSVVFESDPYTKWNFEVQAANPAGETQWSRTESAQTQDAAPGPVSDLRVQPVGSDSLQVSWRPPVNPNGHITGYEVTYQLLSRGMCENVQEAPRTVTTTGPHHVLTGLHPHSRYRVGVAAKTTFAGERVSSEIQTDQAAPTAAPSYLRVDETRPNDVSISWQAPPCLQTNGDLTEYEYEVTPADRRSTVQKSSNNIRGNRAQIQNLQPYTRYNVKVRAYTARGPGPWSTEVPFQTAAAQTVSAPPFVRVVNTGEDNAHLVWQSPHPDTGYIDKYKCKYGVTGTQNFQEKQFPAISPCQQRMIERQQLPPTPPGARLHCGRIDNLQPEHSYDFQVSAHVRDGGWSPWSEPERTKVTEAPVQILSVDKIGGTDTSLTVAWNVRPDDRSRVTSFRLTVSPIDGSRPLTFNLDRNTYQYRVDNLRPRSQYNVTVQAATSKEVCGGTQTIMWTDAAPLTALSVAPRVIAEEATSVTIEWDSRNREAGSFIVEYRLEGGAWQQHPRRIPAHPSQTTYTATVDGLPTNSVIDLRVRVVSQQNEQSNPSPEVRARTKCSPPPNPPQGIRLDAPSTNEVRVSWARPAKNTWMCDQMNTEISYRAGNGPEKVLKVPGDQTEYTFPAEPNQRWIIKLRATNQVGSSPWSAEQTITTRQGAPGSVRDLRVKALSPNEVHVQWLAPLVQRGTIVGYDISYRLKHRLACPEEEPRDVSRDFVTVYNHKDLDYTITGLLPYSLYEVRVRARTTELGPEEMKEVSTEQQPPSAPPLNLEQTYALERSLSFQWEPVECSQRHGHIINYEYEIIGQDDWAKLERQTANTSDAKITIDGLTPFTKYVVRVRAYNSVGGGPFTENLDVMTAKANAPLPPQDLVVAQEGTDFFMVSWLPPYPPYGPHDAHKVRYQLLGATEWTTTEKGVKDPALQCPAESPRFCFNATGLESGQQYKVQVATRIEGGTYGPWSSIVIANTLQVLPDAPRAIHLIDKSDHHLHIRWVPPVDPKGHITQYRVSIVSLDDANDKKKDFLVDHPTLTYIFDQLNPETSYNISISAGTKRGFGREIWTRYSTDPFVIPIVGTVPSVTPDGSSALDVEWPAVADPKNRVKGYIIEIRNADTNVWQEIGGVTAHDPVKRTYLKKLSGLDPDTLYIVRIKVVDNKSRVGQPSPEAQGRTGCAAPTAPPSNVNLASPSNVQVRVSWQAPVKASWRCSGIKYKMEFINGTSPRKQIDLPSSSIEHLFDSPSNTKWVVRIRTENDAGSSEWSKELEITTAEGAPGPVTDLTATPRGPTSVVVTWRPPTDPNGVITGYTLVYKLKSIGQCGPRSSTPIEKHVRSETQTLDGLLPDSTYEIHVIAHTSHAGPQSSVVTVTTEEAKPTGPPTGLRVGSITSNRADVMWTQPDCELRNGKITDYEYELESLDSWGENVTNHHEQERLNLNDLVPYTEYRIRVRAMNAVGEGPFTEWLSFTTQPAAPPPPTDLQEEASFPHSIEISFLPPSPPHGIIDYYRIRHTPSGQLNYKEVRVERDRLECSDANKRDRLCFRVTDLDPEQDYDIQVAAHTEGGSWSEWSDALNARTEQQVVPVLERELEVVDTKPISITLKWEGLPQDQAQHVVGYVLEYKSEDDDSDWSEYNGVTKHRKGSNEYKITVKELEPSTMYFFRLKVVGKNDKRGSPGPETKAMTSCGKPEEPPSDVKMESVDFETMKISWNPPSEESWRCDNVEFVIDYANTTSRGQWAVSVDAPNELIVPTMPGTKWEIKMKTQTKEENGNKPQSSRWSDKVTLTTQSMPGELFVTVEPKGPKEALVTWDLPDKDQKWNYGVDITYRLKQLGGCTEAATGSQEPITRLNVQEKQILLEDLIPGSTYEVIVTPRRPPSLHSSVATPKTVRTFKTKNDVPTGPPQNVQSTSRKDTELGFKYDPPECLQQNGDISQYEWELSGLEAWNEGTRESVTPRLSVNIPDLQPGSLYRFKVRAYTAEGPGPWSDPLEIRTTGSELGPPREMSTVHSTSTQIQLTWLPPYPEKAIVTAYRLRYSPRADDSNPTEVELSGDELSCTGYRKALITSDHICATVKGLLPATTYRFSAQGRSTSGNWGEWSPDYFTTTRTSDDVNMGGSLRLLSAAHDNLKVKWTPPELIGEKINRYEVNISVASSLDEHPKKHEVNSKTTEFHFRQLSPVTQYNVTVQGFDAQGKIWWISGMFSTTDIAEGLLTWLPAPTDLHLIEKSDTMLHVDWVPPEVFDPEQRELITHYRVTIAPFDEKTGITGTPKNYTVMVPGNSIKFEGLDPETVYNITVQAGTNSGYGHILWGTYSTLAPGQPHVLRLLNRTPTTLTVAWDPKWGKSHSGYTLTSTALHSVYPHVRLGQRKTFDVDASETQATIRGLHPSTVYNVTLKPKDHHDLAWGAYATLPPGWFTVKNLKQCDRTDFAVSLNWEPLDMAQEYQVRYMQLKANEAVWIEEKPRTEVLCPKDFCNKDCYLVYNLQHNPTEYVFQIRVKVEGEWNHWKSAPRKLVTSKTNDGSPGCCIVPPPFFVKNIGAPKTTMEVSVVPPETKENVMRTYVVMDEREPAGESNWTLLTDKVSAKKTNVPFYVTASYTLDTLSEPIKLHIGNGEVIGGYLNYPLSPNKTHNYMVYTLWNVSESVVAGSYRAGPYLHAGWPWWWLLLPLLLLLLSLLLCCLILWCLQRRNRARREILTTTTNGQRVPLLEEEKHGMEANLRQLEDRVSRMREGLDSKAKGDFEDGYMKGYRDANKLGSASEARRRMDGDYGARDDRFHEGYAKGLKDAGMAGMSTSMHNLAQRGGSSGGYSAGFMQGYKDGNAGHFGDRVTPSLISRLDEQYPGQDDFKQGFVDGFKEGVSSRVGERRTFEDSRRLQQSLTELTERLTSLEKTKGDEIHSTKIYHVYNQQPETGAMYTSSTGQQLATELEEQINTASRRSTLRRHYTPGDYLKYTSEGEGYGSLGRNRRSLSASALARESSEQRTEGRSRHASGTGSSYITRAAADRQGTDTYSKRYNYRSRSDVGSPRRYASQTLLDGSRPGPSTPHARRDALHTLQKELDTLSRSPDRSTPKGYMSDNVYDTVRSKARGYSNYDYDTFSSSRHEVRQQSSSSAAGAGGVSTATTAVRYPVTRRAGGESGAAAGDDDRWAENLIDIVSEPMNKTLDRMKKYSSNTNVEGGQSTSAGGDAKEVVEEKYHRSYKEEHSSSGR